MATIINPITTVLLNRQEFDSGEFDRFPFKYILEGNGTITYYSTLNAGRYLLSHEASIPGLGVDHKAPAPVAKIQPLAYGHKIPGDFFHQIKQFFLDVMDMGPSTYEAQVFIVWNEGRKDYRIVVPAQTVSAAAVRYDIGDMLGEGDVIIVDIHSHNDMGAFFSGTDNADDKKNPWISGVFGKLSTDMQNKFRFNDGCGRHFDMLAEEVFDFKDARFQTPPEWIAQVKIQTPKYSAPSKFSKVDKWSEAFGHSSTEKETFDEGWGDFGKVGVDEGERLWDSLFSGEENLDDPGSDLYDTVVDILADYSQEECKSVLTNILDAIDDVSRAADLSNVLSDREFIAFMEIDYNIRNDNPLTLEESKSIIESLLGAY